MIYCRVLIVLSGLSLLTGCAGTGPGNAWDAYAYEAKSLLVPGKPRWSVAGCEMKINSLQPVLTELQPGACTYWRQRFRAYPNATYELIRQFQADSHSEKLQFQNGYVVSEQRNSQQRYGDQSLLPRTDRQLLPQGYSSDAGIPSAGLEQFYPSSDRALLNPQTQDQPGDYLPTGESSVWDRARRITDCGIFKC